MLALMRCQALNALRFEPYCLRLPPSHAAPWLMMQLACVVRLVRALFRHTRHQLPCAAVCWLIATLGLVD
jgi:hypothetical protein